MMCNTARALIALSAIAALAQAAAVDSTAATAGAESQGAAAAAASESTTSSRPDTIVLKGIVYEDANNNGVLDAGEAVNSDAQVWLLPGSDATGPAQSLDWPSARADNNGYYEFSWLRLSGYKNIVSGNTYTLAVGSPAVINDLQSAVASVKVAVNMDADTKVDIAMGKFAGLTGTEVPTAAPQQPPAPSAATAASPSAPVVSTTTTAEATTTSVPVASPSSSAVDIPIVEIPQVSLSGHVFNDLNANNVMDDGETGWQHWQIRLYPNSDPSKVITYSTEDPSGFFEFTPMTLNEYGFGPGEYTLIVDGERYLDRVWDREIQQTRLILAENKPVALDLPISAPAIQLQVSGHIFMDHNANGVWDGEEPVMRSWEMALTHEIIPGAPKTITQSPAAADGYYAFMPEVLAMHHFRPGTYQIKLSGIMPSGLWVDDIVTKTIDLSDGHVALVDFAVPLGGAAKQESTQATQNTENDVQTAAIPATTTTTPCEAAPAGHGAATWVVVVLSILFALSLLALGVMYMKLRQARRRLRMACPPNKAKEVSDNEVEACVVGIDTILAEGDSKIKISKSTGAISC